MGYARLEVSTAEGASQHDHAQVTNEDLEDLEDNDEDPVLTGCHRRSLRKSTQIQALKAADADEEEPEASQAQKLREPKTKATAEPKQTTLTQPQGVKRTLSLPDPGTGVGSTSRSKMLAAGWKKKKKKCQRCWWRCSLFLRDICRLGNPPFLLSFFRSIISRS